MDSENPFLSSTFVRIWCRMFNKGKPSRSYSGIKGPTFVEHGRLPFLYNCGRIETKGINYELTDSSFDWLKGKVLLIYDVLAHLQRDNTKSQIGPLRRIIVKQYPGYLVDLTNYDSFENYMTTVFNGKHRRKLFSYRRKLQNHFKITSTMFFGHIDKATYDVVFDTFHDILKKRFKSKKEVNSILKKENWDFYKELSYPMILEKKASLFVVYDQKKPICIMLNFIQGQQIIGAITGFDISYQKYNIGTVGMMNQFEWAFKNSFSLIDFSKGEYKYKSRWGSTKYCFEYHILYDGTSLKAKLMANVLGNYFKIKQGLRVMGLNRFFHQVNFRLGLKMN